MNVSDFRTVAGVKYIFVLLRNITTNSEMQNVQKFKISVPYMHVAPHAES
jgi:hypothetical protein